jgi:osmotically-inducible protein OsmY
MRLYTITLAILLMAGLPGCASLGRCDSESCSGDAKITADVRAMIVEHPEFGPPAAIRVQTINGVVYLNGIVDTDLVRLNATALVQQIPNVKDVVNSLDARNQGR